MSHPNLLNPRSFVAMAAVAAVAVAMLAIGWSVDAAPGDDDSTFVPVAPCRLLDTRPASQVGPRDTPLGEDETFRVQAVAKVGECVFPPEAIGLSLNVTTVDATLPTFLTLWGNGDRPLASSMNPAPGQPPTPNAVTTPLDDEGGFNIYNLQGDVHAIVDVNGYHTQSSTKVLGALALATPFVEASENTPNLAVGTTPEVIDEVAITAPAAGSVTVSYSVVAAHTTMNQAVYCAVSPSNILGPLPNLTSLDQPASGVFRAPVGNFSGSIAATTTFEIGAGETVGYRLVCESDDPVGGIVQVASVSGHYTPDPGFALADG